jgi:circadian clock protein KaiB
MTKTLKGKQPVTEQAPYLLKLFVTTYAISSLRAIRNLTILLQENFAATYQLEIIDIKVHPLAALKENITAVPLLIRETPEPQRRMVGDMSDTVKVLAGLRLPVNWIKKAGPVPACLAAMSSTLRSRLIVKSCFLSLGAASSR